MIKGPSDSILPIHRNEINPLPSSTDRRFDFILRKSPFMQNCDVVETFKDGCATYTTLCHWINQMPVAFKGRIYLLKLLAHRWT